MTRTPDRQAATLLIEAAVTAGARRAKACAVSEISERPLRRRTRGGQVLADQRPLVQRPEPRNKLSEDERATVPSVCNSTEFASLPPSRIVPKLAEIGRNWPTGACIWPRNPAFTACLAQGGAAASPRPAKAARPAQAADSYKASGPCQVWTWE